MPILWVLAAGVLCYLLLKHMEKQYDLKNKKSPEATPPAVETDYTAPSAVTDPAPEESTDDAIFIDTIPGLPQETKQELERMNLTTAESISDASDKTLLSIKGIGPARLKQFRSLCADTKNQ